MSNQNEKTAAKADEQVDKADKTADVIPTDKQMKDSQRMMKSALAANAKPEAKTIKEKLDAQPKVKIRIPIPSNMDPEKAKQLFVPVTISGYTYQINRGVWVEVPTSVAEILAESNYI